MFGGALSGVEMETICVTESFVASVAWRLIPRLSPAPHLRVATSPLSHSHRVGMTLSITIEPDGSTDFGSAADAIAAVKESLNSGGDGVVEDGGLRLIAFPFLWADDTRSGVVPF